MPSDGQPIFLNGNIQITSGILKLVGASAAKVELGALFVNAKEAKIIRLILEELGHPQPPTPIHINILTTVGIVNNMIKRQRSRSMEMRYFWLLDQEARQNFDFLYQPGQENMGDYPSKEHVGGIHKHVKLYDRHIDNSPKYLQQAAKPSSRRGCAETPVRPISQTGPITKDSQLP